MDAGTLFKFLREIKVGNLAVYPSKSDRMVNIGKFTGQASYVDGDE